MKSLKVSRAVRVGILLKEEIAEIIQRDMKDPGLKMVTVTHVKVSRDMKNAQIFFTVLGESGDAGRTGKILNKASGFIRGELGKKLRIKRVPDLSFTYDDSFEKGMKLERLIEEISKHE